MVTTSTGVVNMAPEEVDIEQRQTLWVGGLNEKVSEEILYELFQNVSLKSNAVRHERAQRLSQRVWDILWVPCSTLITQHKAAEYLTVSISPRLVHS